MEWQSGLLKLAKVIGVIYFIWAVYYTYQYVINQNRKVIFEYVRDSKEEEKVSAGKLPMVNPGDGVSFTLSFWVYLSDWGYLYNQDKTVLEKGGLRVFFAASSNDLVIEVPIYDSTLKEKLAYRDFPLQKWVQVFLVMDGRNVDLWINDKLYASKLLSNAPQVDDKANLFLTPKGGFSGYMSRMYVYPKPLSKRYIMFLYSKGLHISPEKREGPISRNPWTWFVGKWQSFWATVKGLKVMVDPS